MGCSQKEPVEIVRAKPVGVYVPTGLRSCPAIPKSHDYLMSTPDEPAWQSEVSGYVTDLHEVARTCKGNLAGVDSILSDHERTVREAAKSASAD